MFYSVYKGIQPGVYNNWDECKKQVNEFKGAKYKKFSNYQQAQKYSQTGEIKILQQKSLDSFGEIKILHQKALDSFFKSNNSSSQINNSSKMEIKTNVSKQITNLQLDNNTENENKNLKKTDDFKKIFSQNNDKINIYTDGSCHNNGKRNAKAGMGIYFGPDDIRNVSEKIVGLQTNNVSELSAIIRAIEIVSVELESGLEVHIYTDSKYSIKCCSNYGKKCFQNNWRKPDGNIIPNLELVKKAYALFQKYKNIELHHVKAHTGREDDHSIGNENADRLANESLGVFKSSKPDIIYIKIPFEQKDEFKKLYNGKWNPKKKKWSIPYNHPKKEEILNKYSPI